MHPEYHTLNQRVSSKSFFFSRLWMRIECHFLARPFQFTSLPVGFRKCANGTLLPLTGRNSSASMSIQHGKIFSFSLGAPTSAHAWDYRYACRSRSEQNASHAIRFGKNTPGIFESGNVGG